MKDETKNWLDYAAENIESSRILLYSNLFNSCLQNVQQCVEKLLKAVLVELSAKLVKTHSISRLAQYWRIKVWRRILLMMNAISSTPSICLLNIPLAA